jgi:hypothetical protein
MAAAICISPAALSRIIRSFANDGVARFRGRLAYIADPQRLAAEARPITVAGA